MKKLLFLLSLSLLLSGCSLKSNLSRQKVQGTISYYNFEQDRLNGEETIEGRDHSAVFLNLDTESPLYKETKGKILIGCISGSKMVLHRTLLQIKGQSTKIPGTYSRKSNKTKTINLPTTTDDKDLTQQKIEAKITLPINLYILDRDLPDQGRINTCYAHSNIKDIKILK